MSSDFVTTKASEFIAWSRKYSLFAYPFVTACCGMEYMAVRRNFRRRKKFQTEQNKKIILLIISNH